MACRQIVVFDDDKREKWYNIMTKYMSKKENRGEKEEKYSIFSEK